MGNEPIQPDREFNDPLDDLLHQAEWPVPDRASIARLESRWQEIRPRGHSVMRWSAIGIAAALLVMGWLLWDYLPEKPESPDRIANRDPGFNSGRLRTSQGTDIPSTQKNQSSQTTETPVEVRANRSFAGRELNLYEQVVYRTLEQRRIVPNHADKMARLQHAMDQLIENPDSDIAMVAEPLRAETALFERTLARTAQYGRGPRRNAAIRLLGELAGDRSVGLLVMLSRQAGTRTVAIQTLIRFARSETIFHLAVHESETGIQKAMARALLDRGDRESMTAYLELVANHATKNAALGALRETDTVSADAFLAFLESDESHLKKAAALTVSRLDGLEISNRLIQMVQTRRSIDGALLALMLSQNPYAIQFLENAARDMSLIAAVNLARCQAQLLLN
ncbi:MAG: hypothetical protein JW829_13820 [Pirellulales bacterium]|nr:hypothetical protein [Pirellulales bacterium]